MVDVTSADLQRVIGELEKAAGSFGKIAGAQSKADTSRAQAKKQLEKDMLARTKKLDQALAGAMAGVSKFGTSFDKFASELKWGGTALFGSALVGKLVNAGMNLSKTYRELTDVGQTFHGSMAEMALRAAQAGLPLEDFAKIQIENNAAIRASNGNFWKVNSALRKNIEAHGMYGLSLDQMYKMTGQQMEIDRQSGTLQSKLNGNYAKDMEGLISTTTALASASDKTREQILALAQQAMQSTNLLALMRGIDPTSAAKASKNLEDVTAVMASQLGDAGGVLSKFVTDSAGGMANFSDLGKTLNGVGLGQITNKFQTLADKALRGTATVDDSFDTLNYFKQEVDSNIQTLRVLADTGNAGAAEAIRLRSELNDMTKAEFDQKQKEAASQKKLTAIFNSLQSMWDRVTSSFREGFLSKISGLTDSFKDLDQNKFVNSLQVLMKGLGSTFGTLVATVFTPDNIEAIVKGMNSLGQGLVNITDDFNHNRGPIKMVFGAITGLGTVIASVVKGVGGVVGFLNKYVISTKHLVEGLAAAYIGLKLFRKISELLPKRTVTVRGNIVNVIGKNGGGILDSILDNIDGGKKKGAGAVLREGEEVAGDVAKAGRGGKLGGLLRGGGKLIGGLLGLGGAELIGDAPKLFPRMGKFFSGRLSSIAETIGSTFKSSAEREAISESTYRSPSIFTDMGKFVGGKLSAISSSIKSVFSNSASREAMEETGYRAPSIFADLGKFIGDKLSSTSSAIRGAFSNSISREAIAEEGYRAPRMFAGMGSYLGSKLTDIAKTISGIFKSGVATEATQEGMYRSPGILSRMGSFVGSKLSGISSTITGIFKSGAEKEALSESAYRAPNMFADMGKFIGSKLSGMASSILGLFKKSVADGSTAAAAVGEDIAKATGDAMEATKGGIFKSLFAKIKNLGSIGTKSIENGSEEIVKATQGGFVTNILSHLKGMGKNLISKIGLRGSKTSSIAKAGAEDGAEIIEKAGAKGMLKLGGKTLGKALPLAGAAFGLYDAGSRLFKGDLAGAGIAGVSTLAAQSEVGLPLAIALDAWNAKRDIDRADQKNDNKDKKEDNKTDTPVVDPDLSSTDTSPDVMAQMLNELKKLGDSLAILSQTLSGKIDTGNRLLYKIEQSAQNL